VSEIDQQFIEYVVKSLVGKPDSVHIDRSIDEKGVLLELTVDPEDLGRVIGKRGATAQSLRTLLRALGTKNDARYNLKIIDNGPEDHGRRRDDNGSSQGQLADDNNAKADDNAVDDSVSDNQSDEPADSSEKLESEETETTASETPSESTDSETEAPSATDTSSQEDQTSDRLAQARQELADLDDLDV
jgi:hypothetical protein